jgi:DNA polymerase I-like protein with 3'-5' exonuclease and polymerase domains
VDYCFVEKSTEEVVSALNGTDVFSFDLETTGLSPLDSRILLLQVGTREQQFIIRASADIEPLLPFLNSTKWLKIIHNAKFEQKFMQFYHKTHIRAVFDTMLAEQVIASEKYARSLAYVVKKYTGREIDKTMQTSFIKMRPMEAFTDKQLAYAATDVEVLFPVYEAQKEELKASDQAYIASIEFDCAGVVAAMELEGIPVDTAKWRHKIGEYRVRERDTRDRLFSLLLDDSTLPEQQGLFERTGVVPSAKKEKKVVTVIDSPAQVGAAFVAIGIKLPRNDKGHYMTDERTLEKIDHPAAQELLEYRGITKVLDSYGESLLDKIHPFTGRLHPDFNQIGAETGRFSCREPNVQQIPEEFREFVGGVQDYKIVGADYSQMELRIIAELSQDPALLKAFSLGGDPHTSTAAVMFGIPPESVTKDQRHIAKTINFGLSYGMGANKLMDTLNANREKKLTIHEVHKINNKYRETYKGVIDWFYQAGEMAYRQGYSVTLGGRKRYFERPSGVGEADFSNQVAAIKRQGGNSPIQGTNADITKIALANLYFELNQYGYRAAIINTVHDEIMLLAHKRHAEAVKEIVGDSMLRSAQELIKSVPVKVDSYISDWWAK